MSNEHPTNKSERPDDAIVVETSTHINDQRATVKATDIPLYRLLDDILAEASVPDLMPAHLATACTHLIDVRETVMSYHRGHINLDGMASYGMSYCHEVRDAIDAHRDRDPAQLVAVGCSGAKNDVAEPTRAADLYRGSYWSCKRDYGSTIGDEWRIVSAEHAVLDPDTEINHYERTPDDLEGVPADSAGRLPNGDPVDTLLDQWALSVHEGLSAWIRSVADPIDPRDVEIDVLLGRSYKCPLRERGVFDALRSSGSLDISFPFQEIEQAQGGNGNQMGWMTDRVAAKREGKA